MAWWESDINVNMITYLMKDGWTIYNYYPSNLCRHPVYDDDIIDPAYWSGVAEKNGFLFIAHSSSYGGESVSYRNYEGDTVIYENPALSERYARVLGRSNLNADSLNLSDTEFLMKRKYEDKINKLLQVTEGRGATAFEEQTAKAKIDILRNQINNLFKVTNAPKTENSSLYTVPTHLPNPANCSWHLECNGVIYALGRGLNTPEKVMSIISKFVNMLLIDIQGQFEIIEDIKYSKKYMLTDSFNSNIGEMFVRVYHKEDVDTTDKLNKYVNPKDVMHAVYKIMDVADDRATLQIVNGKLSGVNKKMYTIKLDNIFSNVEQGLYVPVVIAEVSEKFPRLATRQRKLSDVTNIEPVMPQQENIESVDKYLAEAKAIISGIEKLPGFNNSFAFKIRAYIYKYNKCSDKQLEILKKTAAELRKHEAQFVPVDKATWCKANAPEGLKHMPIEWLVCYMSSKYEEYVQTGIYFTNVPEETRKTSESSEIVT